MLQKFTCWKAPQQCDILKLDCHHGVCQSQIDRAVCKCDPGFGGEQCTVNKTALKWYSTTENSVLSAPTFNAAALVCTRVILILAFVLKARNTEGEHLTDPQLHLQVMRAFILALAGLFVIGFRHPAILGITVTECRLWFIVINTMYSTAIGLYFLEALNVSETASLDHHNTWIGDFYGNTEHRRSLGFRVLSVVLLMLSGSVFVFGTMFDQVASTWTCLGVFSEETINLWMPLVLFNTIAAMAATAFSYDALFVLRHFPQFRSVQEKHFKTAPRTEKDNVEKCQRDPVFTLIAPWLLLGSWLSVQVSGDWAVDPTVNFLTTASGMLYCAFDLLHHAITTPSLYSKIMWIAMIRLPSSWAPLEDPVSMWTRDEVLSRFKWRAQRSGTRRARRPHYLHPASEGYMPLKVRKENEKRWSESYTKLREAYPRKTKATIIHLIHRQDVVRLLTKEPSAAKRTTIRRVYMRWSSRTYRDDPKPDATLSMETERERMQREWDELRDMLFEFDEDGNVRLREPGELDRVPPKVEEKPKPLKSITMSYVVTIDAYGYTEVHEVFRTPLTHIKAEDLPSTSSARSDVNRIEFGEYKPGSGPINGYVIDKETLAWLEVRQFSCLVYG
ncbi:unnamed protein product [Heligmosomoides polygyrus]|uniref:EGF-like domain-containing protein n=1 Tax=Heligmosomoides polygyrus TaxID=6339 RepID=A0A183FET8_HELPZ|nr:unnamed protein product [Heligmosomoides polygyrus]